jgi:uncharacterized membrane protein
MLMLASGLLLWAVVHFLPSLMRPSRAVLVQKIGMVSYRLIFAGIVLTALALIISGWKQAALQYYYVLPAEFRVVSLVFMYISMYLFANSFAPGRIKNFVRHPQLAGVAVWSFAHLLVNGDSRSLLLFGGMGVWAIIETFLLLHRDNEYQPVESTLSQELKPLFIGGLLFVVLLYAHPWLAGVAIF